MIEDGSSQSSLSPPTRSAAEIQQWLVRQIAEELKVNPERIDVDQSMLAQGVDSMHLVALIARLEDWLGIRFSSDPLEDQPSIAELALSLAQRLADRTDCD